MKKLNLFGYLLVGSLLGICFGTSAEAKTFSSPWSCANVLDDTGVAAFRTLDSLNSLDPSLHTCKRLRVYFSCSSGGNLLAAISLADAAGKGATTTLDLNRPEGTLFATDEFFNFSKQNAWGDRIEELTIELTFDRKLVSISLEKFAPGPVGPGGIKSQIWTCGAP